MDEFLFRSSQKLDVLQIQLGIVASRSKDIFQEYTIQSKNLILQALNSSRSIQFQETLKEIWLYLVNLAGEIHYRVQFYADPRRILSGFIGVFGKRWTRRDVCFGFAGFLLGGIVGIAFGLTFRKQLNIIRYMQAVQCRCYIGSECITVVEDAIAPFECGENEVLIDVKAASVQVVDNYICNGYGKALRKILRKYYENSKSDLPVTLGRDCTGVVTDIGKGVTRLEIGDEVWLSVPFWAQGTLSQTVKISEVRVGKKPKNIGFEGACSVPYAGCLALEALKKSNITFENAQDKRVLVHRGCTPVGCTLIQILKHWGADVAATCNKRALPVAKALGSDDIVIIPENDINDPQKEYKSIKKELEVRDKYDVIILTGDCSVPNEELQNFCKCGKSIISTVPRSQDSDSYGFLRRYFLGWYIWFHWRTELITGVSLNQYDEAHMCHSNLDQLAGLVKNGHLQTVVDKVFQPQDIDMALLHIESSQSIGSTVITFR